MDPRPDDMACGPPSAALLSEVTGDCARMAAERRRKIAVFGALGLGGMLAWGLLGPRSSPVLGTLGHGGALLGFAVLGLILCALAFGVRLPAGRRLKPVVGLGVGGALVLLWSASDATVPVPTPTFLAGSMCMSVGVALSIGLVAVGMGVGRGVLRRHAPTGLLLGVGAGLLALIPLHFSCPDCSPGHLLAWHGLIPALSGAAAGVLWSLFGPE